MELIELTRQKQDYECLCGEINPAVWNGYPDYPHDGGVLFDDKRYWLYCTCRKCGYDMSYPKILNRWRK